jgi:plastocyanin
VKRLNTILAAAAALALVVVGSSQSAPASVKKLFGTVGPGFTITLKKANGKRVRRLKPGRYTFVIKDKSASHNFHLIGNGLSKKTGVSFVGTKTWKALRLKVGKYKYRCDPHRLTMRGTFKVVS